MKKYWDLFIKKRWHLHSLAFVLNFVYFYCGNQYNFMELQYLRWQGIKGTEYILQPILSLGASFFFAFGWEIYQGTKGANRTDYEWKNNAIPDIKFTTIIGFIGYLLYTFIFELKNIMLYF